LGTSQASGLTADALADWLFSISRDATSSIASPVQTAKASTGKQNLLAFGKGFSPRVTGWIMSTVKGGRVCININDENGLYFKTHRGSRQGDPLSPLLFNLAVDALDHILRKAKERGHIKGVIPHLVLGGLTHLQYADDTVIMMDCEDQTIVNMKFLLYCFEWMTGLKINYHKSEGIAFGVSREEQDRIANMMNCKVGRFPMTYLGLPISVRKRGVKTFEKVLMKMKSKQQPWKGRN